ncbi:hypothetical protein SRHO_G00009250 [Serrasalmus rhombeus]
MALCVRLGQLMHRTDEEAYCVNPELSMTTSSFVVSSEPRSCMQCKTKLWQQRKLKEQRRTVLTVMTATVEDVQASRLRRDQF